MNTISHPKIQRIGITYESIILFLIPAIQSIPILFNTDREGTFDSWKLFIFFGFAIFGFNFLIHLMLALLRNHKRSELLQRLLRMIIWSLLIVNTVENQIIYLSSVQDEAAMDLNTQKIILLCSCVGVFAYAIINHHTTPSEREKKLAVCATIIYFSLRLSIDLYDPSLAILGGLLCAILVRVFYLITKTKLSDPAKQAVKDVENFLLKLILSDTEDAFVVLQNNHNVLYSNPKSLDFLQTTSGNLLDGLRELKNLDALSTEEQVKVKDQLFESMLGEGEENEGPGGRTPKFSSNDMNFGKTARNMTSPRDTQSHLTREHTLLNSPMGKPDKSFFSMKSRPRHQSFMSINSSKFKPVSPLLGPKAANKLKSLPLKSFKTGENESKTQSDVFSYANVGEDNIQASHFKRSISRKESNLTHSTTKKDFSLKRLFSKRESLLKEGKSQNILPKDFEIDEEKIFKAGIPRNLKTLFNYMEMTQVPSIDFPFTIDQVVNNLSKGVPTCKLEFNGYIQEGENNFKLIDVMLKPIFLNRQPILIIRLRDKSEKEFNEYLRTSENSRVTVLASVSHELRTPLNCIITMLDMVEKFLSNDLRENYIHPATSSARLLLNLVNDILDFSQSRARALRLSYAYFNLKQHIGDILKLMDIQARGKGLDLLMYYDPRVPLRVYSDPNRVRQIIINLIGNALKFTTSGSITVKVFQTDPNTCKIMVTDTGVGIKDEDLKNLFRRFSKLSDTQSMNQQGVGLGLVISNMLAKMLGPNENGIKVHSRYGVGTTFSFELKTKANNESDEMDFEFSSDEDGIVSENMKSLKEKSNYIHQKKKAFERKISQLEVKRISSNSKSYSLFNTVTEKESPILGPRGSRDDPTNILTNRILPIKEQYRVMHRFVTPKKAVKIDPLNIGQRSSFSVSEHERANSFGAKGSFRARVLFEEEEYVKNMDDKDMLIKKLSSKLNTSFEEAYIMIVDDNAFNIIALRTSLESLGFRIDSSTSGDNAIQKIIERREKYDNEFNYKLIFMDCSMPFKDGYEVTREIRLLEEQGAISKMAIVAVTASTDAETIQKCYDSGMDGYLTKPVRLEIIKDVITQYMGKEA